MKKSWILHGLFISYPEKEETWHELKSYGTYTDALSNARRKNEHGIDENGYFAFRIIERTYSDKMVFDSQSIQLSRAEAVTLGNKIRSALKYPDWMDVSIEPCPDLNYCAYSYEVEISYKFLLIITKELLEDFGEDWVVKNRSDLLNRMINMDFRKVSWKSVLTDVGNIMGKWVKKWVKK